MGFIEYIVYILKNAKKSTQGELNAFFEEIEAKPEEYSKQAFSKGRKRIRPEAIRMLLEDTVKSFYQHTSGGTWMGYHLLGIDGTKTNLPNTAQLREIYGEQKSSGAAQVQALVSCLYDVLNHMLLDVRISSCKASERDHAEELIGSLDSQLISKPLFLMDRGYPSAQLLNSITEKGYHYVIRCSKAFARKIPVTQADQIVEHRFTKVKHRIKLRVIKIRLSDAQEEILITNLFDPSISIQNFADIYHKRWGIESKYDDIKNKLELENVSGATPDAVLQDFYAALFLSNLAAALQFDLRQDIDMLYNTPEKKYRYQLNVNVTISELKRRVVPLLLSSSPLLNSWALFRIRKLLLKAVVPVRPGRSLPRIRRHKSLKSPLNSKLP